MTNCMQMTGALFLLVLPALGQAPAAAPALEPGVIMNLYDVGVDMRELPTIAPGQKPNAIKTAPNIDWRGENGDFSPFKENFVTDVVGFLKAAAPGKYGFRLTSDDGARLWIDGKLVVNHDGAHPATGKEGNIELTAGQHELHILHFQGGGGLQLTLEWLPPGAPAGRYGLVPDDVLSHAADIPREVDPSQKRIVLALRKGRPGDGTPVQGSHPAFAYDASTSAPPLKLPPWLLFGRAKEIGAPLDAPPLTVTLWLPLETQATPGISPLEEGGYGGQYIVRAGPGGETKRVADDSTGDRSQGVAFRFSQPAAGALKPTGSQAFEMRAVRAMSNGFEIEFTKPLDPRCGWDPDSYYIEQWPFDAAKAVAPYRDGIVYPVKTASVSAERLVVFLEIAGLKPSHVVYLRLLPPCVSADGELPWSTEAWYTLNAIPQERKGVVLAPPPPAPQNFVTDEEKAAGWRLLFDGKTTNGWHGYKKDKFPDGWQVSDASLVRVAPGGDIITDDEFQDFELKIDWRISPGGNSGIMYRVTEDHDQPWQTGPEYQVLDNVEHADGREPKTSAASCYGLYAPVKDVTVPVGLFNQTRLVVQGNHVEHWLNNVRVIAYDLHSPAWQQLVKDSKFNSMPDYGSRPKGKIDLQDHGDKVWYRNIKIRALPPPGQ